MEIFKTDILKKEFEIFQKEVLIDALECGLCEKTAYESWHKKFLVSCKYCRGNACKAWRKFRIAKDTFFANIDDMAQDYFENFKILSSQSLKRHY